jgi:hypothetical protein
VPDGGKYLWNLLRRKQVREMMTAGASAGVTARAKEAFESGGSFDLDGYEVSSALARGLEGLKLADLRLPEGLSTLLIGAGPRGRVSPEVAALHPLLPAGSAMVGLDVEPFWDRIERTSTSELQSAVLDFLRGPTVSGGQREESRPK